MATQHESASQFQKEVCGTSGTEDVKKYKSTEVGTRPYGKIAVEKSGLPRLKSDEPAHIFDLATGTGAVIKELYDSVPKEKWTQLKVLGGDVGVDLLEYLKDRGEKEGWVGLETRVIDGNDINLPANTYTHIFISFALFIIPNALPKLYELLKPGGFIGVTTWAVPPGVPLLSSTIANMKDKPYVPSSSELEKFMYSGHSWGDRKYLASQLSKTGFRHVDTVREEIEVECGTSDQFLYMMSFPAKLMSMFWQEDMRETWLQELNAILLETAIQDAGGKDKQVRMKFDGIVGWGWKSA